jgi:hypothetical protein
MCLFLCLTLFSGLIHATSITGGMHTEHAQTQVQQHDCHTLDREQSHSGNTTQCQTEHYQCCLAVALTPSPAAQALPSVVETFLSAPPPWTQGLRAHAIYKPPKYAS